MAPPKTGIPTVSIRMAADDVPALSHLKTQLMAQSSHEVMAVLLRWAMTEPAAVAQLRRLSPRWQSIAATIAAASAPVATVPKRGALTKEDIDDLLADV